METTEDKLMAFNELLFDIADELGIECTSLTPKNLEKIKDNLGHHIINDGEHLDITSKQLYDYLKGNNPYKFSEKTDNQKGGWHGKFAFALHILRSKKKPDKYETEKGFNQDSEEYWKEYLKKYSQRESNAPIVLIDKAFWKSGQNLNTENILSDFLLKGSTKSLPYIISENLFPAFSADRGFFNKASKEDEGEIFHLGEVVFLREYERGVVAISSQSNGEGKTGFIWNFIWNYYESANFFWINDITSDKADFPKLTAEKDLKDIVLVIDDKLEQLEEADNVLFEFFQNAIELHSDKKITLLIVDVERLFIRCNPIEQVSDLCDLIIDKKKFKASQQENRLILNYLLKRYPNDNSDKKIIEFNFLSKGSPLANRVSQVLNSRSKDIFEWDKWKTDKRVKEAGLTYLYSLIAIFQYYDVKYPLDYQSKLLPSVSELDIINFFDIYPEFRSLISRKYNKKSEHPTSYLCLVNYKLLYTYFDIDSSAKLNANFVIDEIVTNIKSGNVSSACAYAFRKFCTNPMAKDPASPISAKINSLPTIELLDRIINNPDLDYESVEKSKGKKFDLLFRKDLSAAQAVINSISDPDDGMKLFGQAKIYYAQKRFEEAIYVMKKLPIRANICRLRCDCYLAGGLLEDATEYYLDIVINKDIDFELPSLISILKTLASQGNELRVDFYFEQIQTYYLRTQNVILECQVIYERAKFNFKWARHNLMKKMGAGFFVRGYHLGASDEKLEIALELIAIGKKLLQNSSTSKFMFLEARILSFIGKYDEAIEIIESRVFSPYNEANNVQMAELYYYRALSSRSQISDIPKGISILERNISLYQKRFRSFTYTITTYLLLARLQRLQDPLIAEQTLSNYQKAHNLDPSNKNSNIVPFFQLLNELRSQII